MKFTPKWNQQEVIRILDVQLERINKALLMRLQLIGETFVTNARLNGTYNDITGNLRSSIGYVILRNGVQEFENFQAVEAGSGEKGKNKVGGSKSGPEVAKEVLNEIAQKYKSDSGFVLICCAGMEYAAAVESKGRDVITASSIEAKNSLVEAIKTIQAKLQA